MTIRDYVRYRVCSCHNGDAHARGVITAKETYEDDNGVRTWWYVRWFDGNGKPDANDTKHSESELVVVGG